MACVRMETSVSRPPELKVYRAFEYIDTAYSERFFAEERKRWQTMQAAQIREMSSGTRESDDVAMASGRVRASL